ncbi:hypothetical protein [Acidovorax sp. SUPP2539]|uniref:hypothetical protein n=1 Tax=Acidovorax sp. SUPP2539 TaxID=2920878 RepID=UPI0023DE3BBF|nr:hypothetical protein [Acidovorax sp. SUPP2539]GKS92217.1 hypothetical protein AVTE2539_22650 [Acidovorax sp. SUPP2539]
MQKTPLTILSLAAFLAACSGGSDVSVEAQQATTIPGYERYQTPENPAVLDSTGKVKEMATQVLGPNYGGLWVVHRDDATVRVEVGVAGNIEVARRSALSDQPGVDLVPVKYSHATLDTMMMNIMERFRPKEEGIGPTVYSAMASTKDAQISIWTKKENIEPVKAILAREGYDTSILKFELQDGPFTFAIALDTGAVWQKGEAGSSR